MTEKRKPVWANPFGANPSATELENDYELAARQWRESEYAKLNQVRQLWRAAADEAGFRLSMSRDTAKLCTTPADCAKWAVDHARMKAELAELREMQAEVDTECQKRRQAIELGIIAPPAEIRPPSIPAPMATFKWPGQ